MFAWFRSSGEILRENIVSSAELFEQSIQVSDCQPENECRGVDGDEAIGLGGLKTSDSTVRQKRVILMDLEEILNRFWVGSGV